MACHSALRGQDDRHLKQPTFASGAKNGTQHLGNYTSPKVEVIEPRGINTAGAVPSHTPTFHGIQSIIVNAHRMFCNSAKGSTQNPVHCDTRRKDVVSDSKPWNIFPPQNCVAMSKISLHESTDSVTNIGGDQL